MNYYVWIEFNIIKTIVITCVNFNIFNFWTFNKIFSAMIRPNN